MRGDGPPKAKIIDRRRNCCAGFFFLSYVRGCCTLGLSTRRKKEKRMMIDRLEAKLTRFAGVLQAIKLFTKKMNANRIR